jgi:hypothetical protein
MADQVLAPSALLTPPSCRISRVPAHEYACLRVFPVTSIRFHARISKVLPLEKEDRRVCWIYDQFMSVKRLRKLGGLGI